MSIVPRAVLGPEDVVAITRWLKVPPLDCLKLFATAIARSSLTQSHAPVTDCIGTELILEATSPHHPFTPPAVRPGTILFWKTRTRTISGTVTITEAAM